MNAYANANALNRYMLSNTSSSFNSRTSYFPKHPNPNIQRKPYCSKTCKLRFPKSFLLQNIVLLGLISSNSVDFQDDDVLTSWVSGVS